MRERFPIYILPIARTNTRLARSNFHDPKGNGILNRRINEIPNNSIPHTAGSSSELLLKPSEK